MLIHFLLKVRDVRFEKASLQVRIVYFGSIHETHAISNIDATLISCNTIPYDQAIARGAKRMQSQANLLGIARIFVAIKW